MKSYILVILPSLSIIWIFLKTHKHLKLNYADKIAFQLFCHEYGMDLNAWYLNLK